MLGFFEYTKKNAIGLGHTHIPFHTSFDKKIIFNPGSVGQPRDMDPRTSYALYDTQKNSVEIHRLEYDLERVSNAIKKTLLPSLLADRLSMGW